MGSTDSLCSNDGTAVYGGTSGRRILLPKCMFAVLLRQGFCVPAAFAGVMMGFVAQYAMGTLAGCWQLPVCTLLWLSAGAWANPTGRITMAAAEFAAQLTAAAVTGIGSLYAIAVTVLTAAAGAGLSILYDGAALSVSRRDELDGDTRPLCILAVCASLAVGLASFPKDRFRLLHWHVHDP